MKKSTQTRRKSQRSRRRSKSKPKYTKPYEGFPLTPRSDGRWCKRITGKLHYFGRIGNDPDGTQALERYNRELPYLKDGREPPPVDVGDGCTMRLLANAFLSAKLNKHRTGELSRRTLLDYQSTTDLLIDHFGKDRRIDDLRPDDFASLRTVIGRKWSPVKVGNEITKVRMIFKFAFDAELIEKPVRYGQSFDRPSARTMRKARNESGPKLFERDELLTILKALDGKKVPTGETDPETGKPVKVKLKADPQLKAMVLLGVNCGFGNTDVASLPQSAVDLDNGWINFPRPKTEIERRVPIWPETIAALKSAIGKRPESQDKADADMVFITLHGNRWVRVQEKSADSDEEGEEREPEYLVCDALSQRFRRLLKKLKINGRRGLGFYTLRHVFETVAGESKDQVAVNAIMGHVDNSMAGVYRERISDERLRAVVDTVRAWFWPD